MMENNGVSEQSSISVFLWEWGAGGGGVEEGSPRIENSAQRLESLTRYFPCFFAVLLA